MLKKIYFTLLTLISLFVLFNIKTILINPFKTQVVFNSPYKVVGDSQNNIFIIDNSKRRIIKTNDKNEIQFIINGGSREKKNFYYSNDITFDEDGNFYILNRIPDKGGFYTLSEEILKYSNNGDYLDRVYKINYDKKDNTLVQRGKILNIKYESNNLSWFTLEDDNIIQYVYNLNENKINNKFFFKFKYAFLLIYDIIQYSENEWIIATKKGEILKINIQDNKIEEFVNSKLLVSPYSISLNSEKSLFFSDITEKKIYQYQNGKINTIISDTDIEEGIFYKIFVSNIGKGYLYSGINDVIIKVDILSGNKEIITNAFYKNTIIYFNIIFFIFLVFLLINFIIFLFIFYRSIKNKITRIFYNVVIIVFVVVLSTFFISTLMLQNFNERYIDIVSQKSSLMVQLISNSFDGDKLEKINNKNDFLSDNYLEIRNFLHKSFNNNNDKWNENYYFALYRVINNKLYAYMYLNDEIGLNYPIDGWLEEENSAPSKAYNGEIVFETDQDQWGSWIYSMGPIRNSKGEVVGLIEIGSDLYSFNQENYNLVKNVLLDIVTLLVVLILIFFEFLFFSNIIEERKENKENFSETFFVRPFNFLFSFAVSMSISFVPLIMKELYIDFTSNGGKIIFNLNQEFVIALAISIELFFFSLSLIIGGILVNRLGFRFQNILGSILAITGLLLSAISKDPYFFLIARAILGLGSGLILISIRSIINTESNFDKKSYSFANYYAGAMTGVNGGVVIGGFIADQYGYQTSFYVAIIITIVALIFGLRYLIFNKKIIKRVTETVTYTKIFKLLLNKKIISYLLFVIMPTYTAGMFLFYYLPLFAEQNGLSISDIGRLFILNGMLIIYAGPFLSKFMKNYISDYTGVLFTSIGWALAILFFSLNSNVFGLVVTIIIMGLVEGFGVVFQNDFFLKIPIVKDIGEDLSVSYFELFAKVAEVIAPILFGWILLFKAQNGMLLFGLIIIFISLIFFLPNFIKNSFKKVEVVNND